MTKEYRERKDQANHDHHGLDDIICVIPEAKGQLNHGRKTHGAKDHKNKIDFLPKSATKTALLGRISLS